MISSRSMVLVVLFSLGVAACVAVTPAPKKEPAIIAVRNNSSADLKMVALSAVPKDRTSSYRFGSVSPVPSGITQSVVRARNAPQLPPEILLRWTDKDDREYRQKTPIQQLLAVATGAENEALVFVIQADFSVMVRLEYTSK